MIRWNVINDRKLALRSTTYLNLPTGNDFFNISIFNTSILSFFYFVLEKYMEKQKTKNQKINVYY